MIVEIAALNVSIEWLKTIGCDSRFSSDVVQGKTILVLVESYKE